MSRIESFITAFDSEAPLGQSVERIEIPLIQRDYAQGRRGVKVDDIRGNFLEVLYEALRASDSQSVSLDFIYGEIDRGTLQPLDGQQRLTTLFLLHWYIASRAGALEGSEPWTRFSYATRQSARRFCERLVIAVPPPGVPVLSKWITDQPWYLFVWRHDPTIQAMLVMIDAIHVQFSGVDATIAWQRLADPIDPAVSFHLLPVPDMGSAEDLYIKMNSRGKPLSDFENFKALFEKAIEASPRANDFAQKIDTDWTDVFWQFRGNNDLVDEEILRYLEFIIDICEWTDGLIPSVTQPLIRRAERVFGQSNDARTEHLEFLFSAFDTWVDCNIEDTFSQLFGKTSDDPVTRPISLFFRDADVNLFESCCRAYGVRSGTSRQFTLGQALILFAVLLQKIHSPDDFHRRLRSLRNLIEGSAAEIRADRMPRLITDTRALILSGKLPDSGNGFSPIQIEDELAKRSFLAGSPQLAPIVDTLEDQPLLRGTLSAFTLDPLTFEAHADAFLEVIRSADLWSDVAGSLLTFGDYYRARGRDPQNSRSFQFVPSERPYREAWRQLLTGATRKVMDPTRRSLEGFLSEVSSSDVPLSELLQNQQSRWLAERADEATYDWRYYMVKYPEMRSGGSGLYFAENRKLGFSLCNLRGGMTQMNSRYRDPYLLTIWRLVGDPVGVEDPWFIGYEWSARFLTMVSSGVGIRCINEGFELLAPTDFAWEKAFEEVCAEFRVGPDNIVHVGQIISNGRTIDTEDRIQVGSRLLHACLSRGL